MKRTISGDVKNNGKSNVNSGNGRKVMRDQMKEEKKLKKQKIHEMQKNRNIVVDDKSSRAIKSSGPLLDYLAKKKSSISATKAVNNINNTHKTNKNDTIQKNISPTIINTTSAVQVRTKKTNNDDNNNANNQNMKPSKDKTKLSKKTKKQKLSNDGDDGYDPTYLDPHIEAEDAEIARLERLLGGKSKSKGIDKKRSLYSKLNKEYEMFEGFGSDFGDFLGQLDELSDVVKQTKYEKKVFGNDNDDDDVDEFQTFKGGHIIDDDEQEASDIDEEVDLDDDDDDGGDDGDDDEDDDNDNNDDYDNDDNDDDNDDDDNNDDDNEVIDEGNMYRPSSGEDIYGRVVDEAAHAKANAGAYVPPALRKQLANSIDESSDKVRLLRRSMNGLMNKLSDQTKDRLVREIKHLFDSNSLSVTNLILKDCIMAACSSSTQMMMSLIPTYAGLVSALHLTVGIDVGAFLVENLTVTLVASINNAKNASTAKKGHSFIGDKEASNYLLLLIYLYNFRTLHHSLIMDIMSLLAKVDSAASNDDEEIGEFEIELLLCLVDHCGTQLRSDDPLGLKNVITCIKQRATNSVNKDSARVRFMLEAMIDLKNNKSKRLQSSNEEAVKKMRKWIGTIKTSMVCKPGDPCLRVTLKDLLNAESRGRWWRAGASWVGKLDNDNDKVDEDDKNQHISSEEQKLLILAQKMKFNTISRRNIFVIIMSSRDINDAFERLSRLDLKGKQDRDIIRVLVECCGQEKNYNAFYAELCSLLCHHNRQYKTTTQFTYWDFFKSLQEGTVSDRKVINLARLLSHLVISFYLPLAIFKPLDMTTVPNNAVLLFLATFFMTLFSSDISEEKFQNIMDRVATTKDFAIIRDSLLFFLQKHLADLASNVETMNGKLIERRRKQAVKILESMNVLDMSAGLMDGDDDGMYDDR